MAEKTITVIPARKRVGSRKQVTEEKPKLRVAAYCRVSTDRDEQETSYEAQVEHYTEFIDRNPEWQLAGIYADATVIIGLKQNPTYGRRFSPIFLFIRAFCGAKRKMLL